MNSSPKVPRFVAVAALDLSVNAPLVLAAALAYVRGRPNAVLHLVHVLDGGASPGNEVIEKGREYLSRMSTEAASTSDVRVTTHLGLGRPWREVVQAATNTVADLIVVGPHAREGVAGLVLGSQAEMVVRKASCPVLVVRKKDYSARAGTDIEPPCPDCVQVQDASGGAELWCPRHKAAHPRPHLHYEFPEPFPIGTNLIHSE